MKEGPVLLWQDSIRISLKSLFMRKFRAALSTLGIVFGVAAVISMMSIGEGAKQEAIRQIKLLGTNNIRVKHIIFKGERLEMASRRFSRGLTLDDARFIEQTVFGLTGVAPLKFLNTEATFAGRREPALLVGTSPGYEDITNFRVASGRFITRFDLMDNKKICILGSQIKQDLFGQANALGERIRIKGTWFWVIGIMESKAVQEDRTPIIKIRNINRDIYIPVTTSIRRFPDPLESNRIEEIAIRVTREKDVTMIADLINEVLRRKHRNVKDFEIIIPEELLAQARRTQRLFNFVMGSITGISLIVGGIGIMNIMLASVSERTGEIGIRRAVGGTKRDILTQFLIETVIICLVGGLIGIGWGFILAKSISIYTGWKTAFSFISLLMAIGASTLIGLLFGLFPARRAAQMDPIQALRFE